MTRLASTLPEPPTSAQDLSAITLAQWRAAFRSVGERMLARADA